MRKALLSVLCCGFCLVITLAGVAASAADATDKAPDLDYGAGNGEWLSSSIDDEIVLLASSKNNNNKKGGRNGWRDEDDNDEGDDDDDGDGRKVCLCHVPPGNPSNAHTICVGSSAVGAHLRHGDTMGSCPTVCGGESGISCDEDQFCQSPEGECGHEAEGVCTDRPATCEAVFDPVCGCDGTTYDNECFAAAAGVTVDHPGECDAEQACGGDAGDTCDEMQYCKREVGECSDDAEGVCADRPMTCAAIFAPVCGCDGITYDNECFAAAAGVTVAAERECDDTGQACGGEAGDTCLEGEFCKREEGECSDDAEGVCSEIPAICPAIFDPVCGCDDRTYSNACMADAAGVTVAATGACDDGGEACGGELGDTCEDDQFCDTAEGECAEEGECADRPLMCLLLADPVCGCDGMTYTNECFANGAGVSVASTGPCPTETEMICDDEIDNDQDRLTDCQDDDCFGEMGTGGVCQEIETTCDDEFDNDADAKTDCDDEDCTDDPACGGEPVETICDDEIDNDEDGKTDCQDTDCIGEMGTGGTCEQPEESCDDQFDNDADEDVDCDDEDCALDPACNIPETETICDDGVDNDQDRLTDCQDDDCFGEMGTGGVCQEIETTCDDEFDNDADAKTDCDDEDCTDDPACGGEPVETICDDEIDNDEDGKTDCQDTDCIGEMGTGGTCEQPEESCDDQFDNDADEDVDCDDEDCALDPACNIPETETICDDGVDNDQDRLTDCQDDDCFGEMGTGGVCQEIETTCDDEFDNDADAKTDCDDEDCTDDPACGGEPVETICDDEIDNDQDGKTDCDDSDCAEDPACVSPSKTEPPRDRAARQQ